MSADEMLVQVVAVEPQRGTVTTLHAYTLPGEPVLVACEPREAARIAADMAAHVGEPTYAIVERWQVFRGDDPAA